MARIALVGPTAADCRDTMVEGSSGLLAIAPNSNRPVYEPSKRRLTWSNGVQAAMFSSEEPDRLRGPQHGAAWLDEMGAWQNLQSTWDMLQFGLRVGKRPRQVITTTPKPLKLLKELLKREDVAITRGRTMDNAENLAPSFLSQIVKRYEGTRLGRQELSAELLEDVQGALWTRDLIEQTRRSKDDLPPMKRIVVGVDPAISVGESSAETGIVVCGLGTDEHAYVLEDASGKFSPIEWARRAVGLYQRWNADRVVAEANQGRRDGRDDHQDCRQKCEHSGWCMRPRRRSRGPSRSALCLSRTEPIWLAALTCSRISCARMRRDPRILLTG